jgi:hypothetical protein
VILETVAVALEREDLGVADEPINHDGGDPPHSLDNNKRAGIHRGDLTQRGLGDILIACVDG